MGWTCHRFSTALEIISYRLLTERWTAIRWGDGDEKVPKIILSTGVRCRMHTRGGICHDP